MGGRGTGWNVRFSVKVSLLKPIRSSKILFAYSSGNLLAEGRVVARGSLKQHRHAPDVGTELALMLVDYWLSKHEFT